MDESQEDDDGVQSEDESHEDDGVQPEDESDAIVDVPVLPHRRSLKLIKDICTRWNPHFTCYNDVYYCRSTLQMSWLKANTLI